MRKFLVTLSLNVPKKCELKLLQIKSTRRWLQTGFQLGDKESGRRQSLLLGPREENADQKFKVRRVLYLKWNRWAGSRSGIFKRISKCASLLYWALWLFSTESNIVSLGWTKKKNGFSWPSLVLWDGVIKRLWERQVEGPSGNDKWGERYPGRECTGVKGGVGRSKLGRMDRAGRTDGHDQRPEYWRLIVITEAVLGGDKAQGEP